MYVPVPNTRRLRAFHHTAETGSASRAAERLAVSQPAVTHAISLLEAEARVLLLERRQDGSFPTPAGSTLFRRTTRFFDQVKAAVLAIRTDDAKRESADRIAAKLRDAQIRNLIAVWRCGSFRKGAAALGIAEPTLQRPARDLESLLGVPLYKRTAGGVGVNQAGAELARRLTLALSEIDAGMEEIGSFDRRSRTSLKVGVLALAPRTILAQALDDLLTRFPRHSAEVVDGAYADLMTGLRDGSIDLIFGALRAPPPFPDVDEEAMFEDPYTVVCRADHPLTGRGRVSASDLADYDWVLPTKGLPRRAMLDQMMETAKLATRSHLETSCIGTIVATLMATDRISVLSRWHSVEGDSPLVCLNDVTVPGPRRVVGLTTRSGWLPTPFQESALTTLRAAVARRLAQGATSWPAGAGRSGRAAPSSRVRTGT